MGPDYPCMIILQKRRDRGALPGRTLPLGATAVHALTRKSMDRSMNILSFEREISFSYPVFIKKISCYIFVPGFRKTGHLKKKRGSKI